jgi:hypothetical protein
MTTSGGVLTFLLSDVEGPSRSWDTRLDSIPDALALYETVVGEGIERNGGTVVSADERGEGIVAVFAEAQAAVLAASEIQRELEAQSWPLGQRLRARMVLEAAGAGAHGPSTGVPDWARGGQVLLTAQTAALVRDLLPPGAQLLDLGERGIYANQRMFQLLAPLANGSRPAPHPPSPPPPAPSRPAVLRLPQVAPEELEARLRDLEDQVGEVTRTILRLQGRAGYRVVAQEEALGGHVEGTTAGRAAPALRALGQVRLAYSRLTELVQAARAARDAPGSDLEWLLYGQAVALIPDAPGDEAVSADQLLEMLSQGLSEIEAFVLAVEEAEAEVGPRLAACEEEITRLVEEAGTLAAPALVRELGELAARVSGLRSTADADPLGTAQALARDLEPSMQRARARIADLRRRRGSLEVDLARARELLVELQGLHAQVLREHRQVRERVTWPEATLEPLDPAYLTGHPLGLVPWLSRLDALHGSGAGWYTLRKGLDRWLEVAHGALASERLVLASNRRAVTRLDELRRRLDELLDRAAGSSLDDHPGLYELGRRATQALNVAPADLEAAGGLVAEYEARLEEELRRVKHRVRDR